MLSPQSRGAQASCDTAATNRCQTDRMPSAAGLQEAQTTKAKLQRDLLDLEAEFAMRQFTNFYHRPSHRKFARLRTEPHRCRHGRDRRQLEESSNSPLSSVRTACLDYAFGRAKVTWDLAAMSRGDQLRRLAAQLASLASLDGRGLCAHSTGAGAVFSATLKHTLSLTLSCTSAATHAG